MIQVTDILVNPMGVVAPNVTIRVFATDTSSDSIPTLPASIVTGSDGSYDFPLGNGTYSIEVNFSDKYNWIKEVTVDVDTATPITLSDLLK